MGCQRASIKQNDKPTNALPHELCAVRNERPQPGWPRGQTGALWNFAYRGKNASDNLARLQVLKRRPGRHNTNWERQQLRNQQAMIRVQLIVNGNGGTFLCFVGCPLDTVMGSS